MADNLAQALQKGVLEMMRGIVRTADDELADAEEEIAPLSGNGNDEAKFLLGRVRRARGVLENPLVCGIGG